MFEPLDNVADAATDAVFPIPTPIAPAIVVSTVESATPGSKDMARRADR
jgi:hypothetical protein